MFNQTYTNTNIIATTYKTNSENFFKASQKKAKKHVTLTDLLKENPLVGKSQYNDINECSLNLIA